MTNHLADANSPYLLQHAENPVDWYPWCSEALQKARNENKPIFLSIGYAACHWCHVMAHESFEDPQTAAMMNNSFVCIKVDREERPDLDSIYMAATQALTGSGGWPMSVFLTPDLRPFYAGTYFPPTRRYNLPSFKELLLSLDEAWRAQPAEIDRVAGNVVQHLLTAKAGGDSKSSLTASELDVVAKILLDSYDWGYGGWGDAPRFPQPMLVEFLLRRSATDDPKQAAELRAALHVLRAMARGGMYDVVGGGFSRYSTDNFWRVPHFEKMLYDNAQLARVYLHAWQLTRDPFFRGVVTDTLDFTQREMTHEAGGFYSSLDADSEGQEGKYYVWTLDEIRADLPDPTDVKLLGAAYGLTERGNWEGKTVLQRTLDDASLAAQFKITQQEVSLRLEHCRSQLLSARSRRVRPATDDKVLTAWNSLMLRALAEAARFIDDGVKQAQYRAMAERNATFLTTSLLVDGQLYRSWRNGQLGPSAFLEDYAALICALLELYQVDFDQHWFSVADQLANDMIEKFTDPGGGFYDAADVSGELLLRPKDLQDNATPSGNALACEALLRLAAFDDQGEHRDRAERALQLVKEPILRYPVAFGYWLSAAHFALSDVKQIAVVYPGTAQDARALLGVVDSAFRPNTILAGTSIPPSQQAPALLRSRPLMNGKATAYVCEHFVCRLPVNSPNDLKAQL
jgi:uncharacterized protein